MSRIAFFTITDRGFFPGALAAVNSVLLYHGDVDVWVVEDQQRPLLPAQRRLFGQRACVRTVPASELIPPGAVVDVVSLKVYAARALLSRYDVIVGIDADCVLCSSIDDVIEVCAQDGGLAGGGVPLEARARHGLLSAHDLPSMSVALYAVASTDANRRLVERWVACCEVAEFNGRGSWPGADDQEIFSAVLHAEGAFGRVRLIDNRVWSQHWTYWDSSIVREGSTFVNLQAGRQRQRAFHCGGHPKFWDPLHRERVLDGHAAQRYPFIWFLAMLWFGACSDRSGDPVEYLAPEHQHLVDDLVHFLPEIVQVYSPARFAWRDSGMPLLDRALHGIPRFLSAGGSLAELMRLVEAHPHVRRFVEVGSFEGGTLLALGLRFLYRDIDFYAVESFTGNLDGTMDGRPLPSRRRFVEHLRRFPGLRVRLVSGDSVRTAALFDDRSMDFVFIDAAHDTASVLADIDAWLPKIAPGGVIAGDDYGWPTVEAAVGTRFPARHVSESGAVWWTRI